MSDATEGNTGQKTVVIVQHRKSMALALILTFFFGPFGMLYATITGGVIMLFVSLVVGVFTLGIGLAFLWPIQLVWAAVSVSNYNARQSAKARKFNQS